MKSLMPEDRPSRAHYLWALLGLVGGVIGWVMVRDRDRKLGRNVLIAGGVVSVLAAGLSLLLTLVTFGVATDLAARYPTSSNGSTPTAATPTGTTPTTETTPTSPTETTIPDNVVTRVWTFKATNTSGYSMTGRLSVGKPRHYKDNLSNGDIVTGTTCSADTQTDAAIPMSLSVTNTTSNFSTYIGATVTGLGTLKNPGTNGTTDSVLKWEGEYSSGPQCETPGSGGTDPGTSIGVNSTDTTAPNGAVAIDGFFIITNYYSPNDPGGNSALLSDAELSMTTAQDVTPQGGTTVYYTLTTVNGPGVESPSQGFSFEDTYAFDLAGTTLSTATTTTTTQPPTPTPTTSITTTTTTTPAPTPST
jgi:hypothetical protein